MDEHWQELLHADRQMKGVVDMIKKKERGIIEWNERSGWMEKKMGSKMNNLLDARKKNNLVSSLMEGLAEMGGQEFTEQPKMWGWKKEKEWRKEYVGHSQNKDN